MEPILKDEAFENTINILTVPHNYSLHSKKGPETLAVALPYSNQIIHYLQVSNPLLTVVAVHEATHIHDIQSSDVLFSELFFRDLHKLLSRRNENAVDIGMPFANSSTRERRVQEFFNLLEASAFYSEILVAQEESAGEDFINTLLYEQKKRNRETYEWFVVLESIVNKIIAEDIIQSSRQSDSLSHKKNQIKSEIVFSISSWESMNKHPSTAIRLKHLKELSEESSIGKFLSGSKHPSNLHELGIALAFLPEPFREKRSIAEFANELGGLQPVEWKYSFLLFILQCLKDDRYQDIIKEYIFGMVEYILKDTFFKGLHKNEGAYKRAKLPLVFYYQNSNKRGVLCCLEPQLNKEFFDGATKIRMNIHNEKSIASVSMHWPAFVMREITEPFVNGAINVCNTCNPTLCKGRIDCPLKNELYYYIKNNLEKDKIEKIVKRLISKNQQVIEKSPWLNYNV